MGDQKRAVFLDLNGTLVMPVQPSSLNELERMPGIVESISRLNRAGFVCPVVTVQSRIAKGVFSIEEFESWFAAFANAKPWTEARRFESRRPAVQQ